MKETDVVDMFADFLATEPGPIIPAPPPPPAPLAEVPTLAMAPRAENWAEQERKKRLQGIEDSIFLESAAIIRDALRFSDIDPGATAAPEDWLTKEGLSEVEAVKRLRVAKLAHLSTKEAPVGLSMAEKVYIGALRSRHNDDSVPRVMNINFVQMASNLPEFPELVVGDTKDG